MNPEQLYEELENLAGHLGVSIRQETLSDLEPVARSGLCKVKGRYYYIMDSSTTLDEKIRLLTECLSQMDLEGVYLLPAIRNVLEAVRKNGVQG